MGLFDRLVTLKPQNTPPVPVIDKFSLVIREINETKQTIILKADQLPKVMIPFGGRQRVVKEYYSGNPEPVMHVMGPEEARITLNGTLKDKRQGIRELSTRLVTQLDDMRRRGNLVELSWGTFRRFGILQETKFDMKTTREYDYELIFDILGFNPPTDCPVLGRRDTPFRITADLSDLIADFDDPFEGLTLERSLLDDLNGLISDVAGVVSGVIGFVDDIVGTAENAVRTVNRAVGVVNNAISSVHRFERRLRALSFQSFSTFTLGGQDFQRATRATYSSVATVKGKGAQALNLRQLLLQLRAALLQISLSLPQARHLVQPGDTLQKLAVRFYDDQTQWTKIKEHNGLTDTTLVPNQVLEIPK